MARQHENIHNVDRTFGNALAAEVYADPLVDPNMGPTDRHLLGVALSAMALGRNRLVGQVHTAVADHFKIPRLPVGVAKGEGYAMLPSVRPDPEAVALHVRKVNDYGMAESVAVAHTLLTPSPVNLLHPGAKSRLRRDSARILGHIAPAEVDELPLQLYADAIYSIRYRRTLVSLSPGLVVGLLGSYATLKSKTPHIRSGTLSHYVHNAQAKIEEWIAKHPNMGKIGDTPPEVVNRWIGKVAYEGLGVELLEILRTPEATTSADQ